MNFLDYMINSNPEKSSPPNLLFRMRLMPWEVFPGFWRVDRFCLEKTVENGCMVGVSSARKKEYLYAYTICILYT